MKKILGGIAAKKLIAGIAVVAVIATIGAGTAIYKHKKNLEQEKIRIEANLAEQVKKDSSKGESTFSGSTSNSTVTTSKIRSSSSDETKQPSQPTKPNEPSSTGLKHNSGESDENVELEEKLSDHKCRLHESDSYRACIYAELDKLFDSMVSGDINASQATNKMFALNLNCKDGSHTNIHCTQGDTEAKIEKTKLNSDCMQLRDLIPKGEYSNFKIFYDENTHTNTIYFMTTSIDTK